MTLRERFLEVIARIRADGPALRIVGKDPPPSKDDMPWIPVKFNRDELGGDNGH